MLDGHALAQVYVSSNALFTVLLLRSLAATRVTALTDCHDVMLLRVQVPN
jgi:hypothetical protein